ncbi:FecCD family ABC transporter permease [Brevibacillus reuszeri]|uniref:FecCD family ABC transporter permease n=1 Tax=Brevibacillus reuszeri TaxID=54915 RepID=UPI00289D1761|nr:iron ABC transporter permease [Brevibacillus reuszeri]
MNRKSENRNFAVLALLLIVTSASAVLSMKLGSAAIGFTDILSAMIGMGNPEVSDLIYSYRLPRVAVALAAGACLSVAGVIAQSVMRNPLAAPDTLGLTSGAGLAAVIVTILFPGQFPPLLTMAAFGGGVVAAIAVYLLAYRKGIIPVRLALVGIAVSAFCSSGIQLLISKSTSNVSSALIWLGGSLWGRSWPQFMQMLPGLVILIPIVWYLGLRLDVLRLGDPLAKNLGVGVERTRMFFLAIAVMLTALAVSAVGTIGFVGLITPHAARKLVGSRHRILIPTAAVLGGLVILIADALGRGMLPPLEIPAGLLVSVIGGPYFLFLLWQRAKQRN